MIVECGRRKSSTRKVVLRVAFLANYATANEARTRAGSHAIWLGTGRQYGYNDNSILPSPLLVHVGAESLCMKFLLYTRLISSIGSKRYDVQFEYLLLQFYLEFI
jgi:hypothetical protein